MYHFFSRKNFLLLLLLLLGRCNACWGHQIWWLGAFTTTNSGIINGSVHSSFTDPSTVKVNQYWHFCQKLFNLRKKKKKLKLLKANTQWNLSKHGSVKYWVYLSKQFFLDVLVTFGLGLYVTLKLSWKKITVCLKIIFE